jgi:hypothetical protein
MYKLYVRDSNFRRIGEISDYNKLDLIPRFNAVGSFALDLPTDCAAARELGKLKYGIIVKKGGQTVFSGTVKSRKRVFNSSGDTMTFSGKDDNEYLATRLTYPEPGGDFSISGYDVRTGKAETVMKQYVNHNAGAVALPERRLLTLEADKGLGGNVTGRGRFHTLLELLQKLAISNPDWGELGFKVVQVDDELQFQVYHPQDRTKTAFFSPLLGNLTSFEYENTDPEANFVIVGGGGEGAERVIKQQGDNVSIANYGRMESFVDQRNTSEEEELNQSLGEELINKSEKNSFNFTPIDTPQLAFGHDYGLGDKVSIILTQPNEIIEKETLHYFLSFYQTDVIETERVRKIQEKLNVIQDIVREVKISITPQGDSISPIVGNQDSNSNAIVGIFNKMKKITSRISNLERR